MDPRYARNIPALSEEECSLLRSKRVAVIGCGGLGGHLIDQLARIGVGFIRAVDGDVFEASNLNRQLLSEVPLLGTGKAQAAADRVMRVNPDIEIDAVPAFLTQENASQILEGCHVVLDGLDNIESRKILSAACRDAGIPYIFGAIQGWVAQAAVSMPDDRLLDILYPAGTVIRDKSVLSFTPALCAAMQVSLCIKILTGRSVETGTIYLFDLLNQEFEPIPLV